MTDHTYRVMPPDLHSRPTGGSPGFQYELGKWTPRERDTQLRKRGFHTLSPAGVLQQRR